MEITKRTAGHRNQWVDREVEIGLRAQCARRSWSIGYTYSTTTTRVTSLKPW